MQESVGSKKSSKRVWNFCSSTSTFGKAVVVFSVASLAGCVLQRTHNQVDSSKDEKSAAQIELEKKVSLSDCQRMDGLNSQLPKGLGEDQTPNWLHEASAACIRFELQDGKKVKLKELKGHCNKLRKVLHPDLTASKPTKTSSDEVIQFVNIACEILEKQPVEIKSSLDIPVEIQTSPQPYQAPYQPPSSKSLGKNQVQFRETPSSLNFCNVPYNNDFNARASNIDACKQILNSKDQVPNNSGGFKTLCQSCLGLLRVEREKERYCFDNVKSLLESTANDVIANEIKSAFNPSLSAWLGLYKNCRALHDKGNAEY